MYTHKKPHIRRAMSFDGWICKYRGTLVKGLTPIDAYRRMIEFHKGCGYPLPGDPP